MRNLHLSNPDSGYSLVKTGRNPVFILASLLFFSCGSYTGSFSEKEKTVEYFTPGYLTDFEEESFKISIDAFENHFGGVLVAKKLSSDHFRFAFINEFGGKLMDFELKNNQFQLNYAIEQLDRKIVLNLLKKDFLLLFTERNKIDLEFENQSSSILKASVPNLKQPVYYYLSPETKKLMSAVLAGRKEKVKIIFTESGKSVPDVEIFHGKLPIKIYLHLLENN